MANQGLSTLTFMDGAMRGAGFVSDMQQRTKDNALRQKQSEQQDQLFDLKKQEAERANDLANQAKLQKELERDLRAYKEAKKMPPPDFFNKYAGFGFDALGSEEARQKEMDLGARFNRAVTTGDVSDDEVLDSMNARLEKELNGRKIIGIQETQQNGKVFRVPVVESMKDGVKVTEPLTTMRDGEDGYGEYVVDLNEEKLGEWNEASLHRADMAYALENAKGDPVKFAEALQRIAGIKDEKVDANFKATKVYDDQGREQAILYDAKSGQYKAVGGAGLSGVGGADGRGNKAGEIQMDDYLKNRNAIMTNPDLAADPEGRALALADLEQGFSLQNGVDPEQVMQVQEYLRNNGITRRPTFEDVATFQAAQDRGMKEGLAAAEAARAEAEALEQEQIAQAVEAGELVVQDDGSVAPPMPEQDLNQIANLNQVADKAISQIIAANENPQKGATFLGTVDKNLKTERKRIERDLKSKLPANQARATLANIDKRIEKYVNLKQAEKQSIAVANEIAEVEMQIQQASQSDDPLTLAMLNSQYENLQKQQAAATKNFAELQLLHNQDEQITGF